MRLLGYILILVFALLLSSCAFMRPTPAPVPQYAQFQHLTLPAIHAVKAKGPFAIEIIGHAKQQTVTLVGTANRLAKLQYAVKDGVLSLKTPAGFKIPSPRYLMVRLRLVHLNQLNIAGQVLLLGQQIDSKQLSIILQNQANVQLKGNVGVNQIEQSGRSHLSIQWVNSPRLQLQSSGGITQLDGVAGTVTARLFKQATLTANGLRAARLWISTADDSQAKVLAVKSLNAFAKDRSLIEYYKTPAHLEKHSKQNANILQAGFWR